MHCIADEKNNLIFMLPSLLTFVHIGSKVSNRNFIFWLSHKVYFLSQTKYDGQWITYKLLHVRTECKFKIKNDKIYATVLDTPCTTSIVADWLQFYFYNSDNQDVYCFFVYRKEDASYI